MSREKPGRWEIEMSEDSDSFLITDEVNNTVAIVPDEATANMIEALPELLEALEEMVAIFDGNSIMKFHAGKSRAAIAKAYGEQS